MEPNIHQIHRRDRRGRRLPAFAALAVFVVLGATWFGLFSFLGSSAAYGTLRDLERRYLCDPDELDLSLPEISELSEVYTADGVRLGVLTERNSQPIPLEEIPDVVVAAALASEDKDFYRHRGISYRAILRAALENVGGETVQGGSTITQQVVKQNFLTPERTIERKICEAVLAAELERRYTKDQILEFYLNSVFFGSNAYGIEAAAREYFDKDVTELTIAEAATLMTPIRNPTRYHPRLRPERVLEARNDVIDRMLRNGYITADQAAEAKAEPLGVVPHRGFEELAPQVMIAVRQELLRNPAYGLGETYLERKRAVFGCPAADATCEGGGGLRIEVTVDYRLQEEATRILRAWFRSGIDGPTGAIAMVDNATGAIRVMASGLEFGSDLESGQRPYDLATQGARQPGSAFKPFTLAAALERGTLDGRPVTLGSYWDQSSPAEIDCGFPCTASGNIWRVSNAGGATPKGLRTLESATVSSINTVYARLVAAIGPDRVVEMARRLGIESPLKAYPSITLGAFGVSPLEMASAYSTFANYGIRREPYLIERIVAPDGTVLYEHQVSRRRVLSDSISAVIVDTLRKVVTNGTGRRADLGRPQAGKTGTATDYRDVWFVGFVPQYSTAVWVGYADKQVPMRDFTVWNDLEGREQFYRRAFGGTLAAPVWKQFMEVVVADLPPEDFPPEPPGAAVYRQVPFTRVPDLAGLDPTDVVDALYAVGLEAEIVEVPSLEPAGTVVDQDPGPGARLRQGSQVRVEVSTGQPPAAPLLDLRGTPLVVVGDRLAAFAAETGIELDWAAQEVETPDPAQWGLVVATDPGPGTIVTSGRLVTVFVGVKPG
ncbi:MAG TPA: PASTA domain-containing protein [Actinobacteria bacterium]|nr:PASTA domain-containing protein [Actinomycetota bacterium]